MVPEHLRRRYVPLLLSNTVNAEGGLTERIASCSNYLCPGTLACVDKPTHCPCAWPDVEEKFELDPDGMAICVSKSGAEGMTKLKVDLARKGLL